MNSLNYRFNRMVIRAFLCSIAIIMPSCGEKENSRTGALRLGACPTMRAYYLSSARPGDMFETVNFTSTAEALAALMDGTIDAAFVGRPARAGECASGFVEVRMRQGHTLVGHSRVTLAESDLGRLTIHTSAPENVIDAMVPQRRDIVRCSAVAQALQGIGPDHLALIPWSDFNDSMHLAIVMADTTERVKSPRFRLPTLYYSGSNEKAVAEVRRHLSVLFSEGN